MKSHTTHKQMWKQSGDGRKGLASHYRKYCWQLFKCHCTFYSSLLFSDLKLLQSGKENFSLIKDETWRGLFHHSKSYKSATISHAAECVQYVWCRWHYQSFWHPGTPRKISWSFSPKAYIRTSYQRWQRTGPASKTYPYHIAFLHYCFMLWKKTLMVSICHIILNSYLATAAFFYRSTVQKVKTSPHRLASNITLLWKVHPLSVFCLTVDCIMKCQT